MSCGRGEALTKLKHEHTRRPRYWKSRLKVAGLVASSGSLAAFPGSLLGAMAYEGQRNKLAAGSDLSNALSVARTIPADSLFFADTQGVIATILRTTGERLDALDKKADEAIAALNESIAILRGCCDRPQSPDNREELCLALIARSQAGIGASQYALAVDDCREAIAVARACTS